jgi:hypothetical protein
MTTNHPVLSNVILATFINTMFVLGLRNKALPNTIMFKNNGISIHGRSVP